MTINMNPKVLRMRHVGRLQKELAALVAKSEHVIARGSGDDIQHDQPEFVVAAVREVVEAVRDPDTWKTP